ncbi:HAMP domain-containing histidine kinase [Macrococcus hajekii]|uniref:Heme sensor protein HssS n=1 Tax=Macrococcus hajekii TaxID=198482 RepID=A0A4R6BNE7_9STAP|nr:HAMP domain-containing sensor histidine kinase [Macrococcus hajekii]TDM03232.1 HAMP domain-containing histidine kinase [Macrococcus hajekii]GGA97163.1 two-component sensor histidine kinase [Macrococcus hajekii]
MFRRLSTHFILSTLLALIFSAFFGFIVSNIYYHTFLKPENDARMTHIMTAQKNFIEAHPEIESQAFFNHLATLDFQVMAEHEGQITYYGTPFRVKNIEDDRSGVYHGIKERPFNLFITGFFDNETRNTVGMTMKIEGNSYRVYMRPDVGQSMGEFRIFLAVLLFYIFIFSIFFILFSSRYLVTPVKKLQQFAKRIRKGDYSDQSSINRRDEIGVLAREMEEMAIAIRHHQAVNERFVANVSHEIQSPITNLIGLTSQLTHQNEQEIVEAIQHQSSRLSGLTKQLLILASIENAGHQLQKETFSGQILMKEVIKSFMFQLNQKELFLITQFDDSEITANRELFFQLVSNLVSNAIKYAYKEGEIKLILQDNIVSVEDNGTGMSELTQTYLFERFYKSDAKEDDIPSNGLGMAIVNQIADLHGFNIEVDSQLNKGTTIRVMC